MKNIVMLNALAIYEGDSLVGEVPATYDLSNLSVEYHQLATQAITQQSQLQLRVRNRLSDREERNLELGYVGRFFQFLLRQK